MCRPECGRGTIHCALSSTLMIGRAFFAGSLRSGRRGCGTRRPAAARRRGSWRSSVLERSASAAHPQRPSPDGRQIMCSCRLIPRFAHNRIASVLAAQRANPSCAQLALSSLELRETATLGACILPRLLGRLCYRSHPARQIAHRPLESPAPPWVRLTTLVATARCPSESALGASGVLYRHRHISQCVAYSRPPQYPLT